MVVEMQQGKNAPKARKRKYELLVHYNETLLPASDLLVTTEKSLDMPVKKHNVLWRPKASEFR